MMIYMDHGIELGLIDIVGTEKSGSRLKIYRKSAPQKDMLHPLILLAIFRLKNHTKFFLKIQMMFVIIIWDICMSTFIIE